MITAPEASGTADVESLARETSAQIERLYILSTDQIERQLAGHGLTIAQYMALAAVVAFGRDVPMSALAKSVKSPPSSLTSIATRLEAMGLIVRNRVSNDRRAVMVRPTEAGTSLVEAFKRQQLQDLAVILGAMPPGYAANFSTTLAHFADAMQKTSE